MQGRPVGGYCLQVSSGTTALNYCFLTENDLSSDYKSVFH